MQSREEVLPNTFECLLEIGNYLEDLHFRREYISEKGLRVLVACAGVFALDVGLSEGWGRLIANKDVQTGAGGDSRDGDGPFGSSFCTTNTNYKIISISEQRNTYLDDLFSFL